MLRRDVERRLEALERGTGETVVIRIVEEDAEGRRTVAERIILEPGKPPRVEAGDDEQP